MSQAGLLKIPTGSLPPSVPTSFVTNSGTAVPVANVLNILATNGVTDSGAGSTVTISGVNATTSTVGVASFNPLDFTVTGGEVSLLSGSAAVQTLTGNSGGVIAPVLGNINTLGTGSITISGAGNTLTTQLTGLTANSVLYGLGTATIGLVASGTTGQVLQTNTGAAPTYSTATYPSTTTINQILYSSAANTVTGLATANNGVLTTGTTGIPVISALSANGQIIIGSGSGAPIAATITAGSGINVTNAANSITISVNGSVVGETITGNTGGALSPTAGNWNIVGSGGITTAGSGSTLTITATGGSFTWVDVTTATQALSVQTGYVTDHSGGVVYTLPATAAIGDQIRILGKQTSWSIAQNATQQIVVSSASSTVGIGGSVASTNLGDCIWLVCITAGTATLWRAESFIGNLTVT